MTQQNSSQNFAPQYPPPPPPPPPPYAQQHFDVGTRMLLPVGRSGWAIAAGYLGLLSVAPIFAPFALITSILALRELKRKPHLHGYGRAIFGLVMGILFTVGLTIMIVALIAK